jgi:toxin ParE1/3/4
MRVVWLRNAARDLDNQCAYVADDDPQAAARLAVRVKSAVSQLARHPAMGRPGRVEGTRELIIPGTSFVVPYRVSGDRIVLIRVLHAAQRWPRKKERRE